jgi:hypothetical protein
MTTISRIDGKHNPQSAAGLQDMIVAPTHEKKSVLASCYMRSDSAASGSLIQLAVEERAVHFIEEEHASGC